MPGAPEFFDAGIGLSQSDFERAIQGRTVEIVAAHHPDGSQAFVPRKGRENSVELPLRSEVDLLGTTIVHNHPDFRTFSGTDLRSAASRRAKGIVAVLPGAAVLRLSVSNPQDGPIDELLDRNDAARVLTHKALGAPQSPREIDDFHRAFAQDQRRLFIEIGLIMSIDGPS